MRLSPPLPHPPGVAAAAVWLPDGRDAATSAVAAGRLDTDTAERLSYTALACDGPAPVLMAIAAARGALAEAGWCGDDVDLVVHASTYDQGNDLWSPAHHIANEVGAHAAIGVCVQQMSNGAVAALEVAASRLAADPSVSRCLVTTADRFSAPAFDRWRSDYDVGYGDGGTALLLERDVAAFHLLSVTSISNTRYEAMHRGATNVDVRPPTVDVRSRKRAFAQTGAMPAFKATLAASVTDVIKTALDEAGVPASDPRIRCLALPRIGVRTRGEFYDGAIEAAGLAGAEKLDYGRSTGHLGAGDIFANLAEIWHSDYLAVGEIALLLSVGAGFTWSCVAVQRASGDPCPKAIEEET
ncbi:MAG TPA: ketoacyl-ACP synthase III family protein [Micromonosporaceae bacterium]